MPISDADMAELEKEFEGELDEYMAEWEKSLRSHFVEGDGKPDEKKKSLGIPSPLKRA